MAAIISFAGQGPLPWIVLIVLGAAAAFILLIAIIVFVGSRFEVIRMGAWRDVHASAMPALPATAHQAISQGLEVLCTGQPGDSSLVSSYEWLLGSRDRTILMIVCRAKMGSTFNFVSRRRDGVWLITKQSIGTPLREGRRVIVDDLQTGQMSDTLKLHRLRVCDAAEGVQRFADAEILEWAGGAQRAVYEDLVEQGLARWLDAKQMSAKLTVGGSFKAAVNALAIPRKIVRDRARAAELAMREVDWPGAREPDLPVPHQASPAGPAVTDCMFVIACRLPDGGQSYMPYQVDGKTYLPVFQDRAEAAAYAAQFPPTVGEAREFTMVSRQWLLACVENGYELTLHLPAADRRLLTPQELQVTGCSASA